MAVLLEQTREIVAAHKRSDSDTGSPEVQVALLTNLLHWADRAEAAVQAGVAPARIAAMELRRRMQRLGEEYGEGDLMRLGQLAREIDYEFDALAPEAAHAG